MSSSLRPAINGTLRGGNRHPGTWGLPRKTAGLDRNRDRTATRFDIVVPAGLSATTMNLPLNFLLGPRVFWRAAADPSPTP